MKSISLSVSESDYEAFRAYAARHDRSIAELIREAMAAYRREHIGHLDRLERIPTFKGTGHCQLPTREELLDEISSRREL